MFDVEGELSGDTVNWLIEVPSEAWARRQLLAALFLLTNQDNWNFQGGSGSDLADVIEAFEAMIQGVLET